MSYSRSQRVPGTVQPAIRRTRLRIGGREASVPMPSTPVEDSMAHALRTPLTALSGAISLLEAEVVGSLPAEARALLGLAKRNCAELQAAVEALVSPREDAAAGEASPNMP